MNWSSDTSCSSGSGLRLLAGSSLGGGATGGAAEGGSRGRTGGTGIRGGMLGAPGGGPVGIGIRGGCIGGGAIPIGGGGRTPICGRAIPIGGGPGGRMTAHNRNIYKKQLDILL